LSLALGAFIAGMVLSESDYSHQVSADILPFRDVFNSIFFVSIGLLLSVSAMLENLSTVLLWVAFLVVGKFLIVWAVVQFLGFPQRIATIAALSLAQIGEFSFVLAKAGKAVNLLPDADYQSFLAASIASMMATPFMIAAAPRFGYFMQGVFKDKRDAAAARSEAEEEEEDIHITSTGGLTNHVLRAVGVSYTILDLNADTVRRAKEEGEKINFGDATRREVLHHAHIEEASALVLAMSDPHGARRAVKQARALNKNIYIVVRTRYTAEITELLELGADEVIPEEFETSIEIFSRVLQRYGLPRHVIESQIEEIRSQGYEMLRSPSSPQQLPRLMRAPNLNEALQEATTETIKLDEDSPAAGKTLGQLDLRERTGATLIAVVRGDTTKVSPGARYELKAGDTLVLFGKPKYIARAVKIIQPEAAETGGFNP
jgi:monovalent cation:H+ antiporter-2, CPA2 family